MKILDDGTIDWGFEDSAYTSEEVYGTNPLVTGDYTVTDFEENPLVIRKFENVMDYLGSQESIGQALYDTGNWFGNDDITETMRDFANRLETKAAAIQKLEGAPQQVKDDLNFLLKAWESADTTGAGEWAESIYENMTDFVFNPETAITVGAGMATLGTGAVASRAAAAASKTAATQKLYKMLQATTAASEANPYKAAALMTAAYGGGDDLLYQELEKEVGAREETDLGQTAMVAGVSALVGPAFVGGSKALSKGYRKLRGHTDEPKSKELAVVGTKTDSDFFDEGLEGEWMPANSGKVIDEFDRLLDGPEGAKAKIFDVDDAEDIEFEDVPLNGAVDDFVAGLGGGERTRRSILSEIRNAAKNQTTREGARSAIKQVLYKTAANLTANFYGKTAGVLTPFRSVSGTARVLQQKLHHDFAVEGDIRKPLKTQEQVVGEDLFEVQRKITGRYNEQFRMIVDELSLSNFNTKFADEMNDALSLSLRSTKPIQHEGFDEATNKAINRAAVQIRELYQDMGTRLKDIGAIKELTDNYVPRMWSRSAIEKNPEGLAKLFVEHGGMSMRQAKATVKSMLNKNEQVDAGSGSGYFFSAKRKINSIADDSKFEEYLNSDVLASLHSYTFQAGKQLAKHRVLGVKNFNDFKKFYINRIKKEVEAAGEKFTKKDAEQLERLYRTQTGEGVDRYGKNAQMAADAYSLTNRVAYLGLATVSSLTEIMLNISKAGVRNSVKGLGDALEMSYKRITKDLESELQNKHGLTANEAFSEMRDFSLYVDQEMSQLGDRLTGDALMHEGMQKASNKFFRLNMLDQWTRFVQNVSFRTGKNMIQENIEALAKYGDSPLDRRGKNLAGELAELGIDYKEGVKWFNNGSKTDDAFYKERYLGGAARYTNSVILQPTGLAGNKPFLMANPKTSILFQLLSYPAAFSNTVLKDAGKRLVKSPVRGGVGRIAPAALLMTGMARWTNYLRTNGESEKEDLDKVYYNAIARWGGNGLLLDSVNRARTAAKYTRNSASYLAMPFGPIASDAMSLYQQGIIPTLGNKVPVLSGSYFGKNMLGDFRVRQYRKNLKKTQEDVFGRLIPDFEPTAVGVGAVEKFNAGGKVAKEIAGNLLDVIRGKTEEAEQVLTDRFTGPLAEATENLIDSKKISEMNRIIESSYVDMLDPDDMLSGEDFANALIVHNIKRKDMDVEEVEKIESLKNALNEKEFEAAKEKFAIARTDLATDDDHLYALETIQELRNDVDETDKMAFAVGVATNNIRNIYRRLKVDLTEEELDKVAKANYDAETISELHDFLTSRVKVNRVVGEHVSDIGASKVARDILFKIAASGDVDLRKFKPPKVQDLDEIPPVTAPPEERAKLIEKHVKDSVAKTDVYRATKRGGAPAKEFFTSFALPREISSHMGGEGAADNIRMRDILFDNWDAEEAGRLYLLKKNQPTKADTEEVYRSLIDTILKNKNSEFRFDDYVIEKGYLNIKNPLVYKSTRAESDTAENVSGTWDVVDLFSTEGGVDELMDNLEDNGIKITKKIATTLDKMQSRAIKIFQMGENTPLEQLKREMMTIELNIDTRQMLKDLGFDGIQYENKIEKGYIDDVDTSYIVFEPQQFKSVDSVGFDSSDPRHKFMSGGKAFAKEIVNFFVPKKASGLYSEAHKAAMQLEGKKPKPGQSFLNELKNKHQITPDELEWTGANARFGNNKPVTKEEFQQFFEENDFDFDVNVGRVSDDQIEAVDDMPTIVNGKTEDDLFDEWLEENRPFERDMLDSLADQDDFEGFDELVDSLMDEWKKETGGVGDFTAPALHKDYSFERGSTKNYREVVMTLKSKFKKVATDYKHPHHQELRNQVAHIRLADIEQADGSVKKTLLIDEVQSDAHQQAKRKAKGKQYQTEDATRKLTPEQRKQMSDRMDEIEEELEKLEAQLKLATNAADRKVIEIRMKRIDAESDKLDVALAQDESGDLFADFGDLDVPVPDLPLKKNRQWGTLGIRQAMKAAAEGNYDQVALTTGRLQAERNFKVGKLDEVRLIPEDEGGYQLVGDDFTFEGEIPGAYTVDFKNKADLEAKLPKVIGKENAEKLLNSPLDEFGERTLSPKTKINFEGGGKEFETFYDKTLIDILNKEFAEKYGVEIKMVEYKRNDKTIQLPTIEMTDKMRSDILKGLKMFAEGGYVISKGDTLSQIAKANNTTVARLAELNKIEDVDKIFIGQRLELDEPEEENYAAIAEKVVKQEPMSEADAAKAKRPVSRKKTVRALKKNLSTPRSSSRTRTQVKETRNGGLFKSQVFQNLATYINPFGGDKTEADYSPEVIEQLKIAARNSIADGRRNIDYADYSKESNVRAQVGMPTQRTRDRLLSRAIRGELTPTEEAAFSVGGAQIKTEGDDVFVTDVYDFSKLTDEERTSKERDRYSYLRDFMAKLPGNEFRSKIKIGTRQDFGL